jgi:hypothetical protein
MQREMPFFQELKQAEYVDASHIEQFSSYREAVVYCWKNRRKGKGLVERLDQTLCASIIGLHAPHFSRCVNPKTKSPMDLKTDLLPAFEAYTGNRAVTQYLNKITYSTSFEEIQARRAA